MLRSRHARRDVGEDHVVPAVQRDQPIERRQIDAALVETDTAKQEGMYHGIQEQLEEIVPSIQPFSEVLDSVGYRADIAGFALNPSWGTDLGAITKAR